MPYLFGAEGYGACCGIFDILCLYFSVVLVMFPGIKISTYCFYIVSPYFHFSVIPQYNTPVQSSDISFIFMRL